MTLSLILDQVDTSDATTPPDLVNRLTEEDRSEITAAMVGVIDRYCGMDPIDMALARELGAECCRIIEARERPVNGGAA